MIKIFDAAISWTPEDIAIMERVYTIKTPFANFIVNMGGNYYDWTNTFCDWRDYQIMLQRTRISCKGTAKEVALQLIKSI